MALDGSCGPFSKPDSEGSPTKAISGSSGGLCTPNVEMSLRRTLASIVFNVVTTLVMRWPVMSWKLHAS